MRENSSSATTMGVDNRPCEYPEETALLSSNVPYSQTLFSKLFSSADDSELTSWTEEKPYDIPGQPILYSIHSPHRTDGRERWQCQCRLPKSRNSRSSEAGRVYKYIHENICVGRLDDVVDSKGGLGLWMAGQKGYINPLWKQKLKGREILITEQADLHLVWWKDKIYIKPLPVFLLDYGFFQRYLLGDSDGENNSDNHSATFQNSNGYQQSLNNNNNHDLPFEKCIDPKELHKAALGLLMTYTKLVRSPGDLEIAHDSNLLPKSLNWKTWSTFVADVTEYMNQHMDHTRISTTTTTTNSPSFQITQANHKHKQRKASSLVSPRYIYGELRLTRLNMIYRFRMHIWRGYFVGYSDYSSFLSDNFGFLVVVFLWLTTALTAMQVATATMPSGDAVQVVSYWFSVVTLIIIASSLSIIMFVFGVLLFANVYFAARGFDRKNKKARKKQQRSNQQNGHSGKLEDRAAAHV